MRQTEHSQRARDWVVDYSAARAKAIAWLGDRYLVAKPVSRLFGRRAGVRQWPASVSNRYQG